MAAYDGPDDAPDDVPDHDGEVPEVEHAEPGELPRRWYLYRIRDHTGLSGCGVVAWGVQFPDGKVAYHWTTSPRTTQFAESIHDVQHIHGHEGKTEVRYVDPEVEA
ncbi:putative protein 3 [Haloarcula hispanica icosahedral virus 2]|uniref:Uncharacterized protein n=1 Tax=Haloarcula hispanica icosahedral virus 2 TaxID=1154689 RepID=H9AZV9_9VIRU|nr:putative protein 3 [Haloarcula hispanica icosahedral virus 2]AFD02284.1 putative protein 3 [Haloarcula hispanica icosahedral virus 2]